MLKSFKNKTAVRYQKICFYIACDNRYFSEGVNTLLHEHHAKANLPVFEVITLDDQQLTNRLLFIQKNVFGVGGINRHTLHVVLAESDLLNLIGLSFPEHPRLRLIAQQDCTFDYLQRIVVEPNQLENIARKPLSVELFSGLSFREKLVCLYIYLECPPKIIGCILGVGEKAISRYRVSIIKKLGCRGKIEFHKTLIKYYQSYHSL